MNIALFYDTETTGLPLFKDPSEHPDQPHIVQLGAALVDLDSRKVLSAIDVMVKPNGWSIPKEVSDIHGITTEMAGDLGVSESAAVEMFMAMWSRRLRVAHNESFDARILRIALFRHASESVADEWKASPAECTAKMTTPILDIPATQAMKASGRNWAKTPKLVEAYRHFFGKEMEDAHNAMADVRGCIAVYFAAKDHLRQQKSA